MAVSVRPLQARDLFTLARVLHNGREEVERLFAERRAAGAAEDGAVDQYAVGVSLLFALLGQAESEVRPWLADMAGLKPAQFDQLSLSDTLAVIEGIVGQEDWPAFLARLQGMISGSLRPTT
jgi:hypothetical protein